MTNSAATTVAVILGVGVFLVIVAVGWRSVQNRRILRVQGANGQETIIVAGEDDDVTNITTTTVEEPAQPAVTPGVADPLSTPEFGHSATKDVRAKNVRPA